MRLPGGWSSGSLRRKPAWGRSGSLCLGDLCSGCQILCGGLWNLMRWELGFLTCAERKVNNVGLVLLDQLVLVRTLSILKETWRDSPFIEHLLYIRGRCFLYMSYWNTFRWVVEKETKAGRESNLAQGYVFLFQSSSGTLSIEFFFFFYTQTHYSSNYIFFFFVENTCFKYF